MGQENLSKVLNFVFRYEGGYVNDPRDPGGATNLGVTKRALEVYRGHSVSTQDVKNLTRAEAEAIYEKNYWTPIGGGNMPIGVDLAAMDVSVNSGPGKARQWYGEARTASSQPVQQIKAICARRLSFMHGLRTWGHFGKGWAARVGACEATALKMAGSASGLPAVAITQTLQTEANISKAKATKSVRIAVVGATGNVGVAAGASSGNHMSALQIGILVGFFILVIGIAALKAMHANARAKAMTEAIGG